jgi:polyhydroxyalkanoate synthesis repressor PhaR
MLRSIFYVAAQKNFDFSQVSREAALQRIWEDIDVSDTLLIKRYASRRLYNTETSDYVTLEDIAGFIREGRDVQIVDLKSGDDLTRQYLLQIVADHESRGENVLPLDVLTDLVRSYTSQAQSVVPQFLAMSFEMLREGQSKVMENMANPMSAMPGYDAMKAQQEAFVKAMTSGIGSTAWSGPSQEEDAAPEPQKPVEDLEDIRAQLAAMQEQLAKMGTKKS